MSDFIEWLNGQLTVRDWSVRKLSIKSGISHTQISNVIAGKRNITFDFCKAIADGLGEPPEMVFRKAGLLPDPLNDPTDPNLRRLLEIGRSLPAASLQDLVSYAEFRFIHQLPPSPAKRPPSLSPAVPAISLSSCPFCGGGNVTYHHNHISGEHAFECDNCGALTMFSVDLSPEQAMRRFNARPGEAKLRAACEAAYNALLPHVEFSEEETETAALERLEAAIGGVE